MVGEGTFPKSPGDIYYSSEVNAVNDFTNDADFFWDKTNKRLGIGTTNPTTSNRIHIKGDGAQFIEIQSSDNEAGLALASPTETWYIYSENTDGSLKFEDIDSTRMIIKTDGKVGIGTTNPGKLLEVNGDAGYQDTADMGSTDTDFASKKYVDDKIVSNSGFGSALTQESTTSTSFIDYNAVNTTLTTSGGKVLVTATFRGAYQDQNMALPVKITRDNGAANSIEMQLWVSSTHTNQAGAITWIDSPGAAAHTYEVQYRSTAGSKTAKLDLVSLSAVEI